MANQDVTQSEDSSASARSDDQGTVPALSAITPDIQLNTRGLRCPEPVMMLHQAIRKSKSGDVVEVFATDNSTSWDFPKFCMHLGHELLLQEEIISAEGQKEFHYLIQKG